jgi:hypothetical protein
MYHNRTYTNKRQFEQDVSERLLWTNSKAGFRQQFRELQATWTRANPSDCSQVRRTTLRLPMAWDTQIPGQVGLLAGETAADKGVVPEAVTVTLSGI